MAIDTGAVLWRRPLPAVQDVADETPFELLFKNGSVYVLTTGFDPTRTSDASSHDLRVWKLNATTGSVEWVDVYAHQVVEGVYQNVTPVGVRVMESGEVYTAGLVPHVNGPGRLFIRKLSQTGLLVWQKFYEDGLPCLEPSTIEIDSAGDVYLPGSWWSLQGVFAGNRKPMVRKINGVNGEVVWEVEAYDLGPSVGGSFYSLHVFSPNEFAAIGNLQSSLAAGIAVGARFGRYRMVAGNGVLSSFSGDPGGVQLSMDVFEGDSLIESRSLSLIDGSYNVQTTLLPGMRTVRFRASGRFLSKRLSVSIGEDGLDDLNWTLVNGDVTGDNVVSLADFVALRSAFGSSRGDGNWREFADLNGDGAVNVQDFLILRSNFGRQGE